MTWALFFQLLTWALPVLVLVWMVTMKPSSRFVKKYGFNLRSVYCPTCGKKQSRVRAPKDHKEAMYDGGHVKYAALAWINTAIKKKELCRTLRPFHS